ncbi:hypothetical protein CCAND95_130044 [Capnocytophaga canis]|nr:hypothetical protein CCAND95_130044 [Capnocytophaga canis]
MTHKILIYKELIIFKEKILSSPSYISIKISLFYFPEYYDFILVLLL